LRKGGSDSLGGQITEARVNALHVFCRSGAVVGLDPQELGAYTLVEEWDGILEHENVHPRLRINVVDVRASFLVDEGRGNEHHKSNHGVGLVGRSVEVASTALTAGLMRR